jgi:hypothetical protein
MLALEAPDLHLSWSCIHPILASLALTHHLRAAPGDQLAVRPITVIAGVQERGRAVGDVREVF